MPTQVIMPALGMSQETGRIVAWLKQAGDTIAHGEPLIEVVPVNGQPAVHPMLTLTLSCDHRAIDGARGARFLDTLSRFIEEPISLMD